MRPETVNENVFYLSLGEKGLSVGSIDDLVVKFNLIDNGEDQNQFQENS